MKRYFCALAVALALIMSIGACSGSNPSEEPASPGRLQRVMTKMPVGPRPSEVIVEEEIIRDFPTLHITSELDPFVQERDFWHNGTVRLEGSPYGFDDEAVRIRGRGNSTWNASFAQSKRPLRLRFEEARPMFGSEHPHREWILLANHFDPTLLRNHAALFLAHSLEGINWTVSNQFIHLYVNGEYMGVYQLTDERNPEPGRGPLLFDPDPAISEYLFELDGHLIGWRADEFEEDVDFFWAGEGNEARTYDIRFPRQEDWDGHLEYLRDFVNHVDAILRTQDYEQIKQVIDIESFVDFYILQEVTKNVDISAFSVFMTLQGQGDDRRIHFGPAWDFDRIAGNTFYFDVEQYWAEYERMYAGWHNFWFRHMMGSWEILELVIDRWNHVKDNQLRQMMDNIAYMAYHYEDDFMRNFERHDIWADNPRWNHNVLPNNTRDIHTWHGQVEYLLEWLEARIAWIDYYFYNRLL